MKNKFMAAVMLIIVGVVFTSCSAGRKGYGCPGNPSANYKFKG